MLNFWQAVLGIVLFFVGILIFVFNIKSQKKEGKDKYGGNIQITGGAIILIIIGLIMLIKELMEI